MTDAKLRDFRRWDISYKPNLGALTPKVVQVSDDGKSIEVEGTFSSDEGRDFIRFSRSENVIRPERIRFNGHIEGLTYEKMHVDMRLTCNIGKGRFMAFPAKIVFSEDGTFTAEADMFKPYRVNNSLWFYTRKDVDQIAFDLRFPEASGPFKLAISELQVIPALSDLRDYVPKKISIGSVSVPKVIIGVHNSADYYNLFQVAREVIPNAHISIHKFRALNLPLDNWPRHLKGRDLVILGDVDTFVLDDSELKELADFVSSGGKLVFIAGSMSLSQGRDPRGLLEEILPVEVVDDSWIRSQGPILEGEHLLIGKGLDLSRFNGVGSLQNLKPKANSQVCLRTQEGLPVCIVGEYGDGKVALLNAYPEINEDFGKRFFWSDEYHDLMKQMIEWIIGKREESAIARLALDEPKVKLRAAKGEIDCRAHILIDNMSFIKEGKGATVTFDLIPEGMKDEVHDVKVDINVGSEKRTLTFQYYPYDWKPEISLPYSKRTYAYRFKVDLEVKVPDMPRALADNIKVVGKVYENHGTLVLDELPFKKAEDKWEHTWDVPDLAEGEYILKVYLEDVSGNVLGQGSEGIAIVPEEREGPPFPITSMMAVRGEGHEHGPLKLKDVVWDLYSHGVNTLFMPNIQELHMLSGLENVLKEPHCLKARHMAYAEMYGQLLGMGIMQRAAYFGVLTRKAPEFDIFAEDALSKAQDLADSFIDYVDLMPRAWSVKVIDELSVKKDQIGDGPATEARMREKFQLTPERFIPPFQAQGMERYRIMKFMSDYITRVFELTKSAITSRGAKWHPVTTFMEPGFGSECLPGFEDGMGRYEDVFAWSKDMDLLDFDIYPYFYPESHKRRFAKVHYGFGFMRAVCGYYDKPIGFFVEIDDRNYPIRVNPVEATGEVAYTAVGQGADFLGTYLYRVFSTLGGVVRPERWELAGKAFKEIGEAGSLIAWCKKRPSQVGLYFPVVNWMLQGGRYYPTFAYELFERSFGNCDLIHEEIVQRQGFGDKKVIVLTDVKILPRDAEALILEFIKEGGILIIDRVPDTSLEGEPLTYLKEIIEAVPYRAEGLWDPQEIPYGDGVIIKLPTNNLDSTYRNAVENGEVQLRDSIEKWAHTTLISKGIYPCAKSDDPNVEANLKDGDGISLLVLVNHNPEAKDVNVVFHDLGFVPLYAANAVTGEEIPLGKDGTLSTNVDGLWGKLVALFPHKPHDLDVKASFSDEELLIEILTEPEIALPVIVDVIEPSGRRSVRYSKELMVKGSQVICKALALNEKKGLWKVQVRCPIIKWAKQVLLER